MMLYLMVYVSVSFQMNFSVETRVFVSFVLHGSSLAVGLKKTVFSLDFVTITVLPLTMEVVMLGVVNFVVEFVMRVSLE